MAWRPLGWTPAFFAEVDPFCCHVLCQRHEASRPWFMPDPTTATTVKERRARAAAIKAVAGLPTLGQFPNYGDVTTHQEWADAVIDVLVGGTPCQDFSVAGKRAGVGGARGNLTYQFAAVARRYRPRWLVWENVPGVFSLNDGRDFGAVLSCFAGYPEGTIFEPPEGGWQNSGVVPPAGPDSYGLAWRVLDAQYFDLAQRRARVFVVGYLGDWRRAAAVLFERESLSWNNPPGRETRSRIADGTLSRALGRVGGGDDPGANKGAPIVRVAPTLQSGSLTTNRPPGLDVDTAESLITMADLSPALQANGKAAGSATQQDAEGGMLVAYGGNNTRGPIEVATAVRAKGGTGHGDFESETFIATAIHARQDSSVGRDLSPPLDTDGTTVAVAFKSSPYTRDKDGAPSEVAPPLSADADKGDQDTLIAFTSKDHGQDAGEISPTLRSMDHHGSHANGGGQVAIARATAVRRLMPIESERLQGFADDYTGILYHGTSAADGPRYRSLGNSKAVPVVRWIGQRIMLVDEIE